MTTLYGIHNCDTVKKARRWLDDHNIDYQFHDVRNDGLSKTQVQQWLTAVGWETLVNKRSTSWKQLDEQARATMNEHQALAAIMEMPTLIKRPLLEHDGDVHVGFKAPHYEQLFS